MIDAKTPQQVVGLEAEDVRVDSRFVDQSFRFDMILTFIRIIRDERVQQSMKEIDISELLD